MAKQLLTKKQQALPPGAKVQTLVRIGRRATAKADWLEEFRPGGAHYCVGNAADPAEIAELRNKAKRAADEICAVVNDNQDYPFWTPQQRAAARRYQETTT